MTIPIILILAVLWAAFFLWPFVQRRLSGGGRDSIGDFSKRITSLGHHGARRTRALTPLDVPRPIGFKAVGVKPATTGLPMSATAQRRRRDALLVLAVATVGSLLLAVTVGGAIFWTLVVVTGLLLVAYVATLATLARRARGRKAQVHYLQPTTSSQSSALVLRRTASS